MSHEPSDLGVLFYFAVPLGIAVCSYIFFIVASLSTARSRTGRLTELMELGALGASSALSIINSSERYLLCTQMGRLLSSFGAGFSLAYFAQALSRLRVEVLGIELAEYGVAVSAVAVTVVLIVTLVAVQVAKTCSLQYPEKFLCLVALPLRLFYGVVGPVLLFSHNIVMWTLNKFDVRLTTERDIAVSADDLSEIVKLSSETGAMEQGEQHLIERVVDFTDRVVREVMTPRKDIVWTRDSADTGELIALCTREGVSRVLVCGSDLDDVRGIILAKDLLRLVHEPTEVSSWKTLIRPTYVVPDTKPIDDLLSEIRSNGTHLAVVLDEHGGVGGIVTLEDLVEQLVGEIFDETDKASDREPEVQEIDGVWHIDGGVLIENLPPQLGVPESEGHYDTLAGYLLFKVGRLPAQGEVFTFDALQCEVTEVHGHRIARLAITVRDDSPEGVVVDSPEHDDELPVAVNAEPGARGKS